MTFKKANKKKSKLRLALCGPTGSGKTYSALSIAEGLGSKIAVIDTECGSASLYADRFEFDVLELDTGHPERYIEAIQEAEKAGYDVLIIDSLSHAWMGREGAQELVDKAQKRSKTGNSFTAWREVTPLHNRLVDAIIQCKCHVIATMRSKMSYQLQEDSRGRKVPTKIGMAPIQRDGMEYEFTIVADLDLANSMVVTKSRCSEFSQAVIDRPAKDVGERLRSWLDSGEKPQESTRQKNDVARSSMPAISPPARPQVDQAQAERERIKTEMERYKKVLGAIYEEIVPSKPKTMQEARMCVELLKRSEADLLETERQMNAQEEADIDAQSDKEMVNA